MGILKNLGLTGSIGKVTVYQRNGKTIMRVKHNTLSSKKRSPAQMKNSQEFAVTENYVAGIADFLKVGFRGYGNYEYPRQGALAFIKTQALREEDGLISVDPALVKVSMGLLPNSKNLQVMVGPEKRLNFSWNPELGRNMSAYDRVMLLSYNSTLANAVYQTEGPFRSEGKATLDAAELPSGTYHIYAAFLSENGKSQSESVYLGVLDF